ncbi:MAG: hypothetical protein K0U80_14945 [Actinomycetia bacterium]|nr:hypothetical protein [Actinomycetes bacterium]MCH9762557.1 hypothetical protein [Actinomycetes bacterium]
MIHGEGTRRGSPNLQRYIIDDLSTPTGPAPKRSPPKIPSTRGESAQQKSVSGC